MSLSWEREASESLVHSRHIRGPLLGYLLAPRTGNLHFEEAVTRVIQENWEAQERAKERFRSSLNNSHHRRANLLKELDEFSQGIEAAVDRKLHKETEARMGVLRTTLKKVEASINETEDCLKESWMREEEAHWGDWGESDSSEEQDQDVIVEREQESGPNGVEAMGPPTPIANVQEAEPSMDMDMEDVPPLTSKDATTVTPEEDEVLMGDPASVAGEMAWLQLPLRTARSPRMGKPHNRSHPPLCVNEVLHLSPLNNLQGAQHEPSK